MNNIATISILLLSSFLLSAQESSLPKTSVAFTTSDSALQKLYDRAEALAVENIIYYGDRKVLKEGAVYDNVWLETQPMGGYMYAKRNMTVAKNNIEIFMDYQRADGRLPGVIYNRGIIIPSYNQFQGLYFAMPAFEMYYLLGRDTTYLNRVYKSLKSFDEYLWKTRDSDNNGCLETWCIFDTGEDHSIRFNEFPNGWVYEFHPTKEFAANLTKEELKINCSENEYNTAIEMKVPIESMEIMSYSYSCRHVLSLISKELNNGEEKFWREMAEEVRANLKSYLWDDVKNACFDKDKDNKTMPILLHNNLRCMHLGSFDQDMADRFIAHHLMNPEEFWTPMPLPSIAANDPSFRNISGNNWSGQPQGLTYQRSIRALENYGHFAELTSLGLKFLDVLEDSLKFTQQFEPFTATINNSKDGYGPSILTTLEFIGRFYGIHITQDKIFWSCLDDSHDYEYSQEWNGTKYKLKTKGNEVVCLKNDKHLFTFSKGVRVVTDLDCNLIEVVGISTQPTLIQYKVQKEYSLYVEPNIIYRLNGKGKFEKYKSYNYTEPIN
ncbi:MAG: hypothetical protein ABFS38_22605 [Bacteroidota bacterium]